jgi:glutathione S-transferase
MKLYYKAGACSLAPHIVLAEMNTVYEVEAVDLGTKICASGDYRQINPKGAIPALKMENGEILTEGAIISQFLADQKPELNLVGKFGTLERYRTLEMMNYIATDIHKSFNVLFSAQYLVQNTEGHAELKKNGLATLSTKLNYLSEKLGKNNFILGDRFTIADAYLFTCLNWSKHVNLDLTQWSNLNTYVNRVFERPAVQKAMKEEGLLN